MIVLVSLHIINEKCINSVYLNELSNKLVDFAQS